MNRLLTGIACLAALGLACPGCSRQQPTSPSAPPVPAQRPQATVLTADEAAAKLRAHPAIAAKARQIAGLSDGQMSVVAMVEHRQTQSVAGQAYWVVGVFESHSTHYTRLDSFLVDAGTGEVFRQTWNDQGMARGEPLAVRSAPLAPSPTPARDHLTVQVFVALCDNENQGIVPVTAALGNGQDARNNLYWGAMYGLKTYFKRSPHWKQTAGQSDDAVGGLDHARFEYAPAGRKKVVVHASAIDGAKMADALRRFFDTTRAGEHDLVVFVGHNGLMDTALPRLLDRKSTTPTMVLCCRSDSYFRPKLAGHSGPLLLSTFGNMAPEAYSLDAALRTWADGGDEQHIRAAAAIAYAQYQRCSTRAARNLFGCK